jgi:cell division protease FtsH
VSRLFRSALIPLLAIVAIVWLASNTLMSKPNHASSSIQTYSELQKAIKTGSTKFKLVEFNPSKRAITVKLDTGKSETVHYASDQAQLQFQNLLEKYNVTFDSKGTGGFSWGSLIASFLPFLLLIGFWIFLMNQVQGGGSKVMSFGKSRAKRMAPDSPKIGFKDVAGVEEAVEELQEIKEFLENPK